jgi:hypothetical protein
VRIGTRWLRVKSEHGMLLVRACVEHVLALVGPLQVHIMLATGTALRTASILAAATSSTILMCVPAAGCAAQARTVPY